MKKVKKVIEKPLKEIGLVVDKLEYKKGELNIILDSQDIIDLDKIVEATHIINKISTAFKNSLPFIILLLLFL